MSNEVKSTQYIGGKIEKVNIINNMPVQDGSISNGGISGEDYTEFKNAASRSVENSAAVGELKSDLNEISSDVESLSFDHGELVNAVNHYTGKFIFYDGTVVDTTDEQYEVFEFDVTVGDVYRTFVQQHAQASYYSIHDESGNVLAFDYPGGMELNVKEVTITIPENGKKLYIGRYYTNMAIGNVVVKLTSKKEKLTNLSEYKELTFNAVNGSMIPDKTEQVQLELKEGYFYANNVYQFDVPQLHLYKEFSCGYIGVNPYETYIIKGYSYSAAPLYGIFCRDGIHWLYNEPIVKYEELQITMPENAIALFVNSYNPTPTQLYRVTSFKFSNEFKWRDKKWVAIGDSITEVGSRASKNYIDYIIENTGVNVTNLGISGTGYLNAEQYNNAFYQRITAERSPDIVDSDVITIFGSGNDMNCGKPLGNVSDSTNETICGAINITLDNILSANPIAVIGIVTPTPWYQYNPIDENNAMSLYSDALVKICRLRGIPCLDLYHCSNLRPWNTDASKELFSCDISPDGDGIHPNEKGHKMIASHFMKFIEELLF